MSTGSRASIMPTRHSSVKRGSAWPVQRAEKARTGIELSFGKNGGALIPPLQASHTPRKPPLTASRSLSPSQLPAGAGKAETRLSRSRGDRRASIGFRAGAERHFRQAIGIFGVIAASCVSPEQPRAQREGMWLSYGAHLLCGWRIISSVASAKAFPIEPVRKFVCRP